MPANQHEQKIIITASYVVKRSDTLLEFLLKKCNTSRNNVKNLLAHHQVLVNGTMVSQFDFPLAKDDEIKIAKNPVNVEEKKPAKRERVRRPHIELLYEDDDFIAISKPEGLLAVESDNEHAETAYNYVMEYLQYNSKQARPFVIHRIDKETSGVLVFAKNAKVQSAIRLNWNSLVKRREYTVVVEGKMEAKSGRVVTYLDQNQNNLMFVTRDNTKQKAITNYEVLKENNKYSLLRVLLETGRKNQIRVHMHYLGHPVVGDDKYLANEDPIKRLGLHASMIEFKHPFKDKIISVKASIPGTFNSLFK